MREHIIKNSLRSSYHRFLKRGISGITASSRVLPNFIIIGTVRSGSTSLYYNICEHPSVLTAAYDEIGYFDSNFHLGTNWYRSMFPKKSSVDEIKNETGFGITGEDTPFYFWKEEVPKRIHELIPNCKLLTILRNPIDRAYSNYNLGIRLGTEKSSFEDSIDNEMKCLGKNTFRECIDQRQSYLSKGMYEKQVKNWLEIFPREQIHFLSTEEMERNPVKTLQKIFNFLEISDYKIQNPQKQKSADYKKMDFKTRELLSEYYRPYNKKFFGLIKQEFDWN